MAWPASQDYNEAIQNPASAFSDPELRRGQPAVNALGLPMPRSGSFADVYEIRTKGRKWAVKCFTREVRGLRERYHEISTYLRRQQLPFMVDFQYLDQGIRIRGQWFPVLKMHWVEGLTLNEFVRLALEKPGWLDTLAQIWLRMARKLRDSRIAHADLQHGNILLVHGSKASSLAVKVIDYDGMLVPRLAQKPSGEVGHPAYQHPERLRTGLYCPEVDRFPNLVIFCALRALLVGGRPLWDRYDNGDNLLFRQKDFDEPGSSPLFQELLQLPDGQVRQLAAQIQQALQRPLRQTPWLEDILPRVATVRQAAKVGGAAAGPAAWSLPERDAAEDVFAAAVTGASLPRPQRSRNRPLIWGVVGICLALATAIPGALWLAGVIPGSQQTNVAQVQPDQAKTSPDRTPDHKESTKPSLQPSTAPSSPPLNSNPAMGTAPPPERSQVSLTRLDPAFAGEYPGVLTGSFRDERPQDLLVGMVVATDHNPPSEPVYIAGVAPVYAHAEPSTPLHWYGRQTANQYPLKAPVGYALGGFQVRGARHLTAIRAIFEPVDRGHLNAHGILMSREIGLPPGKTDRTITKHSPTWPVVGLHGNAGNGIGRLGLIFRYERARPSQQARREADGQVQQFMADNNPRIGPDSSQSLAKRLLEQGLHERLPALRYQFLLAAGQEAARQADVNTALAAADRLSFGFAVSRPPLERQLLEQVWQKLQTQGNGVKNQQQVNRLCVVINQKIHEALDLHDVLSARELAVVGEKAAPRAGTNRIWKQLMANMRRELDQALRHAAPSVIANARGTPTTTEPRSPPRKTLTTSTTSIDSRLPVPAEQQRVKILADLHQRYGQRYDSSDPRQRATLAQEFLLQGRDEATDQVSRYVFLQEAGKLAAGAESLPTALEAVNQLGANYAVNVLELKATSVEAAAAALRRPSRALIFVPLAATAAEELIAANRYHDAARVLAAAEKGARLAGQPATVRLVSAQREFVQQLADAWEKLKTVRIALQRAPTDPVATEAVGRFVCLAKGDWSSGLELLARGKGGDLPVQNAAKLDLARPDTGSARRELADAYRRLSEQADGLSKLQLGRRAVHWYRAALLSDLSGSQAQQTLEDMHRLERLPGFRPPEVPGSFRRLAHPEESLTCLAVAPDGLVLATGATGEPIRLYDPDSGRKRRSFQRARGFNLSGLAFNSTGQKILAYDSRGVLDVWDIQTGARDTAYRPTVGPLKHAVWAGSDTVVTAGTSTWFQRLAADGSNEIKRVPNRTGNINCLAGSADGRWIALGTMNGVVEVYTANRPTLIAALPHPRGAAEALAFTPDGKHLVAAYADRSIVRWDVKRVPHAQLLARSTTPVEHLAVSGDGRRITWTSGDRLLHYADGRSRKETLRLDSLGKPIKGIAWMPDGQHAISADEDGAILLWSLPGD